MKIAVKLWLRHQDAQYYRGCFPKLWKWLDRYGDYVEEYLQRGERYSSWEVTCFAFLLLTVPSAHHPKLLLLLL